MESIMKKIAIFTKPQRQGATVRELVVAVTVAVAAAVALFMQRARVPACIVNARPTTAAATQF